MHWFWGPLMLFWFWLFSITFLYLDIDTYIFANNIIFCTMKMKRIDESKLLKGNSTIASRIFFLTNSLCKLWCLMMIIMITWLLVINIILWSQMVQNVVGLFCCLWKYGHTKWIYSQGLESAAKSGIQQVQHLSGSHFWDRCGIGVTFLCFLRCRDMQWWGWEIKLRRTGCI